jgi:hypothetical protein
MPIQNLFNCVETVEATVACQIQSIRESDVELLQEILTSKLFESYEAASSTLEDSSTDIGEARRYIEKAAIKLCERNKILLRLQRTPVVLLSITEKIIDTTFGGLSGKLAGVASELGKEYLVGHGRVVLYNCSKMVSSIIQSRFQEYIKLKGGKF